MQLFTVAGYLLSKEQIYYKNVSFRLQAEVEEVLEGRTEVTYEDLEKLQYTEQVICKFYK